jgi:hypothetical protein
VRTKHLSQHGKLRIFVQPDCPYIQSVSSLSGNKADKARSWDIPIVNKDWLEDCFVAWKALSLEQPKYRTFPDDEVTPTLGTRGLDTALLLDEVEVIAEVERRADELADLDIEDNASSEEPGADDPMDDPMDVDAESRSGAMDVDEPTSQLKRRSLSSEGVDASSDNDDESRDTVATAGDPGMRRPTSVHKANVASIANGNEADESNDESVPESAPTHRLRSSSGKEPASHTASSPRKPLSSPVKRHMSVVLPLARSSSRRAAPASRRRKSPSPLSARAIMDLGESDDEELLKGPSISPRRKRPRPSASEKNRSPPPPDTSDDELASRPSEPAMVMTKAKGKGKERTTVDKKREQPTTLASRTKNTLLPSPSEPAAAHLAVTTPARKSKPSAPALKGEMRLPAHGADSDVGGATRDMAPARRSMASSVVSKGKIPPPANDTDSDGVATDAANESNHLPPSSSAPSSDMAMPSAAGRSRRSAATKATQRLHDEIMPDVVNFQKELRRGTVRAVGEKEREAELRARAKENKGEKRRRTSELAEDEDEDESEPGAKKRKVSAKGKAKGKATPEVDEHGSEGP